MSIPAHFLDKLRAGRAPSALILTGEGKTDLAMQLAAAYLCTGARPPCGDCRPCRKIAAGIHPDLILATEQKVDAIRALRSDVYIRPNEAERKIYMLPEADGLNPSAQNALLKIVEEGPLYAVFLFLAKNPESLLLTLRSRCELLRTQDRAQTLAATAEVLDFLDLLTRTKGTSLSYLRFVIALEKKPREELSVFLDSCIETLISRLPSDPKALLPKLDALREIRAASDFNISAGHLSGWLMTLS